MSGAMGKLALLSALALATNLATARLAATDNAPTASPTASPTTATTTSTDLDPYTNGTNTNTTKTITPSPNAPIPKPECDSNQTVSIRYSGTSARLYIESVDGVTRGGCVTLEDIWVARGGKAPLYAVDPLTGERSDNATGTWLLEEELFVEDGITLKVYGGELGGVDELRLKSTDESFLNLRAHGGNLDFMSTKVFAWDTNLNDFDRNETDGRSYISAVSEVITDASQTCLGTAKKEMGEARMDIENSEMGYLGYHDSESYGLTWKVRGFCTDKSNPEIFDEVNVYGNIYDSDIHDNNFGVYTYGHQQGDWRNNLMHNNSGYGFDPHDDSDFLTIHDNTVYNNGYHGIIASKRCNGVSIQGNEVYGGAETSAGIFLHRSSDDAIVMDNYVHDNGDAGMALMETFNAQVSGNVFENNKYGIRMSVGCGNNVFEKNVISNSSKYNTYTYLGSDLPDVVESGRSQDNIFRENAIIGGEETIKIKEADGTQFIDNDFVDATTIRFDDAMGTIMSGNTGLDDADLKVINGACFGEETSDENDPRENDEGYGPTCGDEESGDDEEKESGDDDGDDSKDEESGDDDTDDTDDSTGDDEGSDDDYSDTDDKSDDDADQKDDDGEEEEGDDK